MLPDLSGLPISGGIIAAGLLYAGMSVFATGPLVAERTIDKSGWNKQCQAIIGRTLQSQAPNEPFVPDLSCKSLVTPFLGREGEALCRAYGEEMIPFVGDLREQQRRLHDLNQQRLSNAVADAGNRCACAASYALEENRGSFAVYAGSLRLVTPPAVKNLSAGLRSALSTPQCAMKE